MSERMDYAAEAKQWREWAEDCADDEGPTAQACRIAAAVFEERVNTLGDQSAYGQHLRSVLDRIIAAGREPQQERKDERRIPGTASEQAAAMAGERRGAEDRRLKGQQPEPTPPSLSGQPSLSSGERLWEVPMSKRSTRKNDVTRNWFWRLTGGRPMRDRGLAFVDQVTYDSVRYYCDRLGRWWMATSAWSLFRVRITDR